MRDPGQFFQFDLNEIKGGPMLVSQEALRLLAAVQRLPRPMNTGH